MFFLALHISHVAPVAMRGCANGMEQVHWPSACMRWLPLSFTLHTLRCTLPNERHTIIWAGTQAICGRTHGRALLAVARNEQSRWQVHARHAPRADDSQYTALE